jgi:hypothetical protein
MRWVGEKYAVYWDPKAITIKEMGPALKRLELMLE